MSIPIKVAKQLAKDHDLSQVIIFGWDGEQTHVVTYGKSDHDCDIAARGANVIKKNWDWPEKLLAEPSRVKKMKARIAQLEKIVKELQTVIDDQLDHDRMNNDYDL